MRRDRNRSFFSDMCRTYVAGCHLTDSSFLFHVFDPFPSRLASFFDDWFRFPEKCPFFFKIRSISVDGRFLAQLEQQSTNSAFIMPLTFFPFSFFLPVMADAAHSERCQMNDLVFTHLPLSAHCSARIF